MIREITAKETFIVRHLILRQGKTIETCAFDGDDFSTTTHFGYSKMKFLLVLFLYLKKKMFYSKQTINIKFVEWQF